MTLLSFCAVTSVAILDIMPTQSAKSLSLVHKAIFFIIFAFTPVITLAKAQFIKVENPQFGPLSIFKGSDLCRVSQATKQYLIEHTDDKKAVHAGDVIGNDITLERVKETLAFLCETYREDVREKRQSRLHNETFLKENFEFIRWFPDKEKASAIAKQSTNNLKTQLLTNIPKQQLFLTKYYAKLLEGSSHKTDKFNHALYQIPHDETALTLAQAEQQKANLTRFQYTRQQVMQGVLLEKQLAKPLVWLTEEALHDVLLQGTGVLNVDGKLRYFNVHRNNGIAYDYAIGKREQARYWYFAEVPSILGYGKELAHKVAIKAQASLAGNVKQLGLGKLMLINHHLAHGQQAQLAILADEGGAFDDNLFQLDLLSGSFKGWSDYYQANKHLPDYADVWILLKKDNG